MHQIRSIYAYESTSPEEISMEENAVLHVHSAEDDWLLVRVEGGSAHLGFVPRNYCEELDSSAAVGVADAGDIQGDVDESREEEEALARQRESSERQRQLKLKDKVETWSISEIEGKKKKKGTLGVGNGAVFFASDTDKVGRLTYNGAAADRSDDAGQAIPNHRTRRRLPAILKEPSAHFQLARPTITLSHWQLEHRICHSRQARDEQSSSRRSTGDDRC